MKTREQKSNGLVLALRLLAGTRTRHCEGHFTQIASGQSQVHRRALCGTMPQDVANGLKGSSVLQEVEGVRVAQAMWALVGNAEPAFANERLKGFRDGSGFQHTHWSAHSQEHSPIRCGRWRPFQM